MSALDDMNRLRVEAVRERNDARTALERIADMSGKTLLGCACDGGSYPHCCAADVRRAHERGANRAFEDAAAIAKEALSSADSAQGNKP